VTTFQRARSEEQREIRRRAILDAAAAMLAEMPVSEVTLNELSRRAGLAKSNVLRYFETREAVLLELLATARQAWLADLENAVAGCADGGSVAERGRTLALVLASSITARPMLCDLLSAQSAVLERNVSPSVAAAYKREALASVAALGRLALRCVPELGDADAFRFAGATVLAVGGLWSNCQPSEAMLAAYAADPELEAMRLEFHSTLRDMVEVLIAGLLAVARSSR
jgi:AcrR family transcriptional regulator